MIAVTRKGFWCGLSFLLGLFAANMLHISLWWIFAVSAVLISAVFSAVLKSIRTYLITCAAFFILGTVYCAVYTYQVRDKILSCEGQVITIKGSVDEFEYIGHGQGYLTVKGDVKGHSTKVTFLVSEDEYRYYDDVKVTGKVTEVKDSYSFLAQEYYSAHGVFIKGDGVASVKPLGTNSNPVFREIREYSDKTLNTIISYSQEKYGGFLAAMLCGDKSRIEPADKTMLYRSGIGHIFAVSGIHLVIITSLLSSLLRRAVKNRRIRAAILIGVTWAFAVFAGLSISVTRSAIMLSIVCLGEISLRQGDCANSLGIAGFVICLAQPYCITSPSFLLSFLSAFAAGVAAPIICKRLHNAGSFSKRFDAVIYSFTVSTFIAPVLLVCFGGFSAVAPLLNILLIPLCTISLSLCFFTAVTGCLPFIAKPLLHFASLFLKPVFAVVELVSKSSVLYIKGSGVVPFIVISAVAASAILVIIFSRKAFTAFITMLIASLAFVLFSNIYMLISYSNVQVYMFCEKKNATAVVVRADKAIVFDLHSSAKHISAVMRVLDKYGVSSVDALFIKDEPYYTAGVYNSRLYPHSERIYSHTELALETENTAELGDETVNVGGMMVSKHDNGFELVIDNNTYKLFQDSFYINDEKYKNEQQGICFSVKDNKVRRLDHELGITNYSW